MKSTFFRCLSRKASCADAKYWNKIDSIREEVNNDRKTVEYSLTMLSNFTIKFIFTQYSIECVFVATRNIICGRREKRTKNLVPNNRYFSSHALMRSFQSDSSSDNKFERFVHGAMRQRFLYLLNGSGKTGVKPPKNKQFFTAKKRFLNKNVDWKED